MRDVLEVFADLYAEGGEAYVLQASSRQKLVDPAGSSDPHEVGFHRGVCEGLRLLRLRVEEKEKHRRETPPADRRTEGSARSKPPRRVH